jgi:FAD/FMN-containing dehydrogenase
MKEFEIVKCIASDMGWEFEMLDEYCMRIQGKNRQYHFDVWCPHHKKNGSFLGYTIHNWHTNKYDRKVFDLEKYILEKLADEVKRGYPNKRRS